MKGFVQGKTFGRERSFLKKIRCIVGCLRLFLGSFIISASSLLQDWTVRIEQSRRDFKERMPEIIYCLSSKAGHSWLATAKTFAGGQ